MSDKNIFAEVHHLPRKAAVLIFLQNLSPTVNESDGSLTNCSNSWRVRLIIVLHNVLSKLLVQCMEKKAQKLLLPLASGYKAQQTQRSQTITLSVHSWILVIFFSESLANIWGAVMDGEQQENPGQGHFLHFFPFRQQLKSSFHSC